MLGRFVLRVRLSRPIAVALPKHNAAASAAPAALFQTGLCGK